jgi:opacity protein-like surface antigen
MKRLMALVVLALTVSTSAFASDVVGRGVKKAGKDTGKVVAVTAKNAAKAGTHVVKFLF